MRERDLISENAALRKEIKSLKGGIIHLKNRLAVFENHPTIAEGIKGETLIADLIKGSITAGNSSYDILIENKTLKLEVKLSRLNDAVSSRATKTFRWAWAKPFGESGNKVYDRLILIGEKDQLCKHLYLDPGCPYIFFDVPYDDVAPLTIKTNRGRFRSIQLTSNPHTARSSASPLFKSYQVSLAELKKRYRL